MQFGTLPVATPGIVLLVEDNPATRQPLADLLRRQGYAIGEAADGAEALTYLRQHEGRVALVLLDLHMRGMSGWEFRQQQRADAALRQVPTVLFTTASLREYDLQTLAADDYLQKPANFDTLLTLIARYCPSAQSPEPWALAARTHVNERSAHTLVLLEADTHVREAHRMMLSLAGYRVVVAGRPSEAVVAALRGQATAALIDVDLPGVSGADALRIIRQGRHLPALALSAVEDARNAALVAGFTRALYSPAPPDALLRMVDDMCGIGASSDVPPVSTQ